MTCDTKTRLEAAYFDFWRDFGKREGADDRLKNDSWLRSQPSKTSTGALLDSGSWFQELCEVFSEANVPLETEESKMSQSTS
jgi:hypothetical protein